MSQRVAVLLEEEGKRIEASRAPAAREQAEALLVGLVAKGSIVWPPAESKPKKQKLTKKYLNEKRDVFKGTRSIETLGDLDKWVRGLADVARAEGILELQKMDWAGMDEFSATALRLIVDGVEPGMVREILENLAESRLREKETRYRKVIEGMISIQAGQNPRMIEAKVAAIY